MFNLLKSFFTHPLARNLNIDSPETTLIRSRIIQEKPFLRLLYEEWYKEVLKFLPINNRPILELGSGAGFFKDFIPELITSEILKIPDMDVIIDGRCLPFKKASLRGIVMIDVFHHIPNVESFLSNAVYCLESGGTVIMIEPWVTKWSGLVYKYLHHEPFEPEAKNWNFPKNGPLSSANGALPWIVFDRDRRIFKHCFPQFSIQNISIHTPFSYLFSGGVSFRFSMPEFLFKRFCQIENKMKCWMDLCGMFATIVLKKK